MTNILACDPSIREFGYAVIIDDEIMDYGCIKTKSGEFDSKIRDRIRRLMKIAFVLDKMIHDWDIDTVVTEQVGGSQSASGVWSLAGSTAVVSTICSIYQLENYWYNKWDVNEAIFGRKKNVSKEDMVTIIRDRCPQIDLTEDFKYVREAVSDSLSIYLTHKDSNNWE